MNMLNNKGFTLVEVLAVIVIIAIIGVIAVPNIMGSISNSKNSSEKIMIANIKTGARELFEEVDISETAEGGKKTSSLINYDGSGTNCGNVVINSNVMTVYLKTLVINGFMSGDGDSAKIINPKTGKDISNCQIKVTKIVSGSDYDVSYSYQKVGTDSNCPTF